MVERLETRDLLAVVVPSVTVTEGFPFDGTIATFTSADVAGSSYQATIAWGDGHSSQGTVATAASPFTVTGTNTYAVNGTYPITVTIVGQGTATGQGQATVSAVTPQATGTTVTPTAGQAFTGVVASFTDPYPSLGATNYVATIAWGDGHDSTGTIASNGNGGYNVSGTNNYAAPGTDTITVTVIRAIDNQTAMATSQAVVVAPSLTAVGTTTNVLTGQIDPSSDTGPSSTDGITAINQPTIVGTATPYAIVEVLGRRTDQAQPVPLGQAITNSGGVWQLPIGPLPDGSYALTASQTPPAGQPMPMIALTPGSQLTIDTTPPAVLSVRYKPNTGQILVVLQDTLSGLNMASVINPANYALVGAGSLRLNPSTVTIVPNASVRPTQPVTAALQFAALEGTRKGRHVWKLALGKITDLAGNPVSGKPVQVSTGLADPVLHPAARSGSLGLVIAERDRPSREAATSLSGVKSISQHS